MIFKKRPCSGSEQGCTEKGWPHTASLQVFFSFDCGEPPTSLLPQRFDPNEQLAFSTPLILIEIKKSNKKRLLELTSVCV